MINDPKSRLNYVWLYESCLWNENFSLLIRLTTFFSSLLFRILSIHLSFQIENRTSIICKVSLYSTNGLKCEYLNDDNKIHQKDFIKKAKNIFDTRRRHKGGKKFYGFLHWDKGLTMQGTESMDLKHSDTLDSVADNYIPNSKSTDLIKPTKLNSQQPSGENFPSDYLSRICLVSLYLLCEKFPNLLF